ncbi:MAG TPA: NADH-quinone oxidoreductase subunit G [Actinomycetota bacterium]|nr:NADH-quinone oxidoreductase subunit G [Actinomycetota bacterium]
MSAEDRVTVTIDGTEVTVPAGTLVIRAAEAVGIEIPRFCDHPYLDPVGACRQCIVEIEGQRKPVTSCTTPVMDGMVVHTQHTSREAEKAQVGMLEFLLINHPLDCPVCDRGGECPLQDQALAWGPGESRYTDPKRVYEKPIPLSPLVLLDRERCVLCARCTRFCDQISGERFIELFDRGAAEQVAIAAGEDFRSPYSGNTVQICPVGALTSSTYRFAARPFDVRSAPSVCPHCASGCAIRIDVRRGEVVRQQARDEPEVNEAWLCDKGRYAFRFPDRHRLDTPMLRVPGLEPVSFAEALGAVAERARGGSVGFLAGGRLTDEDAFALSKLARVGFGTNDLDHRPSGGWDVPPDVERVAAAGMPVSYGDVERAGVILVVGLDSREELPILHLRIRKAARRGARVVVIHPRRTALADVAEHVLCRPGREADVLEQLLGAHGEDTALGRAADALGAARGNAVVLAGPRLATSVGAVSMAVTVATSVGGGFAFLPRRAGDRGALRAGVHPALLPGGRRVEGSERGEVEAAWGSGLPAEPGRDTAGILEAAARRELEVLYLVGVDPLADFPDADLARRAVANVPFLVVQDIALGEYREVADVVLPAAAFLEKDGHLTDWEGRGQRISPVRGPVGMARPDWQIFQELSEVIGADMGFASLEALHREMGDLLAPRDVTLTAGSSRREEEPEGLVLFTYQLLVDEGRLSVDADELKAALAEDAFVEIHPEEAARLGVEHGGVASIRTEAGQAELPVRVSAGVAPGTAFVPWNQRGLRANTLFRGSLRIAATLEPAGAGEEVAS